MSITRSVISFVRRHEEVLGTPSMMASLMRKIIYDPSVATVSCPMCGATIPWNRVIQRDDGTATAHCNCGLGLAQVLLPEVEKKLIYLDQSFLSDAWESRNAQVGEGTVRRILSKIQELKYKQQLVVVVSDIHSAETSAIPIERTEKRDGIWELANGLADGVIAPNWSEVFLAQQRRALETSSAPTCLPLADIGLNDPYRLQVGQRIVMTNRWRGRLHEQTTITREEFNAGLRSVLERQRRAHEAGNRRTQQDCVSLVRDLWRRELLDGIAAVRNQAKLQVAIEKFLAGETELPQFIEPAAADFRHTVNMIVHGMGADALERFEQLLEKDPNGGCPCVRLHTALEAEVLWSWCSVERTPDATFNDKKFGRSRSNDLQHVAAFLPYVDALTTDDGMANLCRRGIAKPEVESVKGRLFSKITYCDLEAWLDQLVSQPLAFRQS